jgi:Tol biopolymer transport system component
MKKLSSAEAGITTSSASASPSGTAVIFFATFLAILSLFATAADARPFDVRDLVSLNRVSDPQLSPDQEQVAFALRRTELKADKGVSGIWMVPAGGGDSIRLTKKGRDARHPRWSPDGSSVYFIRKHEDSKQIWRVELASGKSKRVSNYPIDVDSFEVSPDGSAIALSMKVFRDCDTLACTGKRLDDRGDRLIWVRRCGTSRDIGGTSRSIGSHVRRKCVTANLSDLCRPQQWWPQGSL